MIDQYYICCVPGSSGMFLSTVMAKYLGYNCPTVISDNGHCHDLGNGIWKENDYIELIGDYWTGKKTTRPIIYSHYTDLGVVKQTMPNVKIVLIDYDDTDLTQVATFRTMKAYTLQWSIHEYNKVAGPDWPPYDPNNLTQSKMIRDECINFRIQDTKKWIEEVDKTQVDYTIDFKTIYCGNLDQTVTTLLSVPTSKQITQFITQYQTINAEYYLNLL